MSARMDVCIPESHCLRQTSAVVFCAVDAFLPLRGKIQAGFDEFSVALDHAGIPAVWVTSRSRAQMDQPIRELGHHHPFIAEDGSGVYLPEDYFHLRPAKTVRLGRFTCIPIAEGQPKASEALESLSDETGVSVVPLRSLSPRELAQNLGLPEREAELARQRDFDELFFFAGASEPDIARFRAEAGSRQLALRQHGVLWSLAAGADLRQCIRELSKLYDRALRYHPTVLGIATPEESGDLFAACDRAVLLAKRPAADTPTAPARRLKIRELPLSAPDLWERVLAEVSPRS
jgi:predicted mannosyl-3-phosphoglycerate phosphatase (HAD superfamily)